MTADLAVRTLLLANASVAAVVAGHVYPLVLPQNPQGPPSLLPAIVYQRVTVLSAVDQDGNDDVVGVRLQLDLWAQTFDALASLRALVSAALNGATSPDLQGVFSESEQDMYDSEVKLYRTSMDFMAFEAAA